LVLHFKALQIKKSFSFGKYFVIFEPKVGLRAHTAPRANEVSNIITNKL
jgi:hypothetical protein